MNDNMKLWNSLFMTDPSQVKPITGKQYKGNSPKPYWVIQRLTETFGPAGIGWGFTVLSERFERLTADDVLHVAHVRLWYVLEGVRGEIEQMGQTKAVYQSKSGVMVDEDAPKKSVTDAMVKAASMIGIAGDIFSGRWDDSKYVQFAEGVWEDRKNADVELALVEDVLSAIRSATSVEQVLATRNKIASIKTKERRDMVGAEGKAKIEKLKGHVNEG